MGYRPELPGHKDEEVILSFCSLLVDDEVSTCFKATGDKVYSFLRKFASLDFGTAPDEALVINAATLAANRGELFGIYSVPGGWEVYVTGDLYPDGCRVVFSMGPHPA